MTRWLKAANGWHDSAVTLPETPIAPKQEVSSVVSVLSEGGKPEAETSAFGRGVKADLSRDPFLAIAADTFPHRKGINGDPRTWTGRVVSLADWRRLSEWERHGPNGRWFYGDTRQWEKPRGST